MRKPHYLDNHLMMYMCVYTCSYGDMRIAMNALMVAKWKSLGLYQARYVPSLIGPFLKVSLVPHASKQHHWSNSGTIHCSLSTGIRKTTIPLFFDMMENEMKYHHSLHQVREGGKEERREGRRGARGRRKGGMEGEEEERGERRGGRGEERRERRGEEERRGGRGEEEEDQYHQILYGVLQMETEMIDKLDVFISGGMGDANYRYSLHHM